jgi:group I intron endonuclease
MITENTAGIYHIESLSHPELSYIGSSWTLNTRQGCHLGRLRRGKHHTKRLQEHFDKFGADDLQFTVICHCPESELTDAEQYYINLFKPSFNSTMTVSRSWRGSYQTYSDYRQEVKERETEADRRKKFDTTKVRIDHNRFKIGNCFYYIACP